MMPEMLARYFALEDDVEEAIRQKCGEDFLKALFCPASYAETGWEEKLGKIFQEHGINLERFIEEFPERFFLENGVLKIKQSSAGLRMTQVLRAAAKQMVKAGDKIDNTEELEDCERLLKKADLIQDKLSWAINTLQGKMIAAASNKVGPEERRYREENRDAEIRFREIERILDDSMITEEIFFSEHAKPLR